MVRLCGRHATACMLPQLKAANRDSSRGAGLRSVSGCGEVADGSTGKWTSTT